MLLQQPRGNRAASVPVAVVATVPAAGAAVYKFDVGALVINIALLQFLL